jgi:hypothetical protein
MAQQTLLQMVQSILSRLDSDNVNSIGDTVESMQVAQIIKDKYNDIVARGTLTIEEQLFQLNPSDSVSAPTLMYLPDNVYGVSWLRYYNTNPLENSNQFSQFGAYSHDLNLDLVSTVNWTTLSTTSITIPSSTGGTVAFTVASSTLPVVFGQLVTAVSGSVSISGTVVTYTGTILTIKVTNFSGSGTFSSWVLSNVSAFISPPGYEIVQVVPLEYFIQATSRFDLTQNNVEIWTFSQAGNNYTFRYFNDRQPRICTVLSNYYVLFDSFDSSQDSTLQASKTLGYGQIIPPFLMQDTFIPALDDIQFPLLINESLSVAFQEMKQMPHPKADQEIKRQWGVTQKWKSKSNKPSYFDQLPNFGRSPSTGGYGWYGYGFYL